MKPIFQLCFVALLATTATGCVYINGKYAGHEDWRNEQRTNREAISRLAMGTERSAVISQLGTPAESEAFDSDGVEVRVLFYRTQRKHSDGKTTRDETTPLVFRDDVLIGWGDTVYAELGR